MDNGTYNEKRSRPFMNHQVHKPRDSYFAPLHLCFVRLRDCIILDHVYIPQKKRT